MKIIDFLRLGIDDEFAWALPHYSMLPDDSTILTNILLTKRSALATIGTLTTRFVFIDCSFDPIPFSDEKILELISDVQEIAPTSRCIFLSSKCKHYQSNLENVVWYPYFMLRTYTDQTTTPRAKRIGCLNRRNAPHRIWTMHNLISQGLIDHERDIYSVSFINIYDNKRTDLSCWYDIDQATRDQIDQYPDTIATVPDNFINDHGTAHPAWSTALTIVSETEVNYMALITEKTAKALVANCCYILHTGADQLTVMEDLGFRTDTVDQHAIGTNIDPILNLARELDTESAAFDYYHSKLPVIKHNSEWFRSGWLDQYRQKIWSQVI